MPFFVFVAWCYAIVVGSWFAELAGVDGRAAWGVGGFCLGVMYTIHFKRRWEELDRDG